MTETSSNVLSIQGEHVAPPKPVKVTFVGTGAELPPDQLPAVGDVQEFTIRAVCKRSGVELVDDAVTPFRQMKVVEISPGAITPAADLEDPALLTRDDVSEG